MIAVLDHGAARHIAVRMREADRAEVYATRWTDDAWTLAGDMLASPLKWAAYSEGFPVAAVGALPRWPGVWVVWMIATDDFPKCRFSLTRHIRSVIIPSLREVGAHRAECASLASHTEAHAWLRYLGAEQEAALRGYGRNGEDFSLFVWRS